MELDYKKIFLTNRIKEYEDFIIDHAGKKNKHLSYAIKKLTQYVQDYETLFPKVNTKETDLVKPIDRDSRYAEYDAWINENISYEQGHFINKKNLR